MTTKQKIGFVLDQRYDPDVVRITLDDVTIATLTPSRALLFASELGALARWYATDTFVKP